MKILITAIALCMIGLTDLNAQDSLRVGDPAPPIVVRKWIKGKPVTKFQPGMVYLVDLWATWCVPCVAAIPHMSQLAQQYKGKVEVLGFDIREDKRGKGKDFLAKVERFVKWSGDRMSYAVAVDAPGGIMEKTWYNATGENGIPEVFVVDQQGKIAWFGHPHYVDDVLEAVVNGRYDEAGKKQVEALALAKKQRYGALSKEMWTWREKRDYPKALALVEEMFPIYPAEGIFLSIKKYELLNRIDSVKARQFGEGLAAEWHAKEQLTLASFILWQQPDSVFKPDYNFALKLVNQAVPRCDPQETYPLSVLAEVNYYAGNKDKAVKYQKKVIDMLKKDPETKPIQLERAQGALQRYQSSAK